MRLRTFTAPSMAHAMQLVRRELGGDAIILSTERADDGIRLTAAVEHATANTNAQLSRGAEEAIGAIDAIGSALDFHGVPATTAQRLVGAAADFLVDEPVAGLAAALEAVLRFDRSADLVGPPGRTVLVGAPGSGKTVTLAKLAASARLAGRPVVAITCDTVRAGSVEQLSTYCKLLDIPLHRAKDARMLERALGRCPENASVLIDTIGTNALDVAALEQLSSLTAAADAEVVLVAVAGGDAAEAAEQAATFAEIGARRMVVTRFDAARRLGSLIAAAEATSLSIVGAGCSPQIGAGFRELSAAALAEAIIERWRSATDARGRRQ